MLVTGFLTSKWFFSLNEKIKSKKENKKMKQKDLKFSYSINEKHWVGNGFHVYGLLRPSKELHHHISPFVLMDYAAPKHFDASKEKKRVGAHPHRGFETVTLAYQGEVQHRDSAGGGGTIAEGDVQWMTAGSGVVHEEFHSTEFSKRGGTFEMVQLWVNLPKKDKMTEPKYQGIKKDKIPVIKIANKAKLRVIAGEYNNNKGPSSTFTPINMFDIESKEKEDFSFNFAEDSNTILLIMRGEVYFKEKKPTTKCDDF